MLSEARACWDRGLTPRCVDCCRRAAQLSVQLYIDARGKTVVMLVNDPGYGDPETGLFNGNADLSIRRSPR